MQLRATLYRILPLILLFFFAFNPLLLAPEPARESPPSRFQRIEKKLLQLINRERKKQGLNPIYFFYTLNRIAHQQSEKMAETGQFSHFLPESGGLAQRLKATRLFFIRCGENLVLSDVPLASLIHGELMRSPDHRSNIINSHFTHCGIRISSKQKKFYITQTFAQLFDPAADSEVEFHLLEDLELWFVKNFNYRFVFHYQSRDYVRKFSRLNLLGQKTSKPPGRWRKMYTFSMVYPDLSFIKNKLKEEITKISLDAISIGVASGRNQNYPGGTYAVTVLLFGDFYIHSSPGELSRILLKQVNHIRVKANLPVLKLDTRQSRQALTILNSVSSKGEFRRRSGKDITLVISLANPYQIPENVKELLQTHTQIKPEIGIGINLSRRYRSSPDQFLVCIVFRKK
jgi:uncharacterized protein YkwD